MIVLAIQKVGARPADDEVVADAAVDHVVPGSALQQVFARTAGDEVVAGATIDRVVAEAGVNLISAAAAGHGIAPGAGVGPGGKSQRVSERDRVVTAAGVDADESNAGKRLRERLAVQGRGHLHLRTSLRRHVYR